MSILVLSFLAAIVSNFNTLPSNGARGYVTYALRHIKAPMSSCQATWDGITPTLEEYDVFLASCTQLNSPALTSADVQTLLADLPNDCYPPSPSCGLAIEPRKH